VVLVVFLFLLLKDLKIVVELFSVQLIESFHFFITFLQVLNVIFHFYLCRGIQLHPFNSQLLDGLFELFLLPSPAERKGLLHIDMLFKALFHFFCGFLDVLFSLFLECILDLI
jgi:hypothetical protein